MAAIENRRPTLDHPAARVLIIDTHAPEFLTDVCRCECGPAEVDWSEKKHRCFGCYRTMCSLGLLRHVKIVKLTPRAGALPRPVDHSSVPRAVSGELRLRGSLRGSSCRCPMQPAAS